MDDPAEQFRDIATDTQKRHLDAVKLHGERQAASVAMGLNKGAISESLIALAKKAARLGHAPGHFEHGVAPGYLMGKVTVQRGPAGAVERVWERQSPDEQRAIEALQAAVGAMAADIQRATPIAAPVATVDDLLALYTLTDAHIGMLAWHREGGADWDLAIAERTIVGCFAETIRQMPAANTAILNQLGDLLHYDGLSAVTPTSGHVLDADGRFTKMVEVAVRVLRQVIALLLAKHDRVHLVLAEGNHDLASSVWLRTMFKALYENEPRITVDDSALPYYAHVFGEVLNVFHHSHLKKFDQVGSKVPALFPKEWGATTKRYCHVGNLHHAQEKEENGMLVIQHPTLAARDAYAARGAWFSHRNMSGITYHRRFGLVGRVIVTPEMLAA